LATVQAAAGHILAEVGADFFPAFRHTGVPFGTQCKNYSVEITGNRVSLPAHP